MRARWLPRTSVAIGVPDTNVLMKHKKTVCRRTVASLTDILLNSSGSLLSVRKKFLNLNVATKTYQLRHLHVNNEKNSCSTASSQCTETAILQTQERFLNFESENTVPFKYESLRELIIVDLPTFGIPTIDTTTQREQKKYGSLMN